VHGQIFLRILLNVALNQNDLGGLNV